MYKLDGLVIQLCIRKFTGYDLRRKAMGKVVELEGEIDSKRALQQSYRDIAQGLHENYSAVMKRIIRFAKDDAEAENWIASERSEYERKCEENSKVIDTLKNEIAGLNRRRTSLLKYEDRVEICNPGRFPTGVTPENIKTLHSSKPRNLHIAQVMYKAAYLEGWGTGIKRMIDVCKAHNLPEPFYQIWADGTIVLTFLRPKTAKNGEEFGEENQYQELTERQRIIIRSIFSNGECTAKSLAKSLAMSERTVQREISFLRNNGYITKEGSDAKGLWTVLK